MSLRVTMSLALTALLLKACAPAETNSPDRTVKVFSNITLGPTGKRRFLEFKSGADFYGALYVSASGLGGGRIGAAPTLEDAKKTAKATCEAFSAADGEDSQCVLYATIEPANPSATEGLPVAAYRSFQKARSTTLSNRFAALAMNADGAYASIGNSKSRAEADRLAIENCNTSAGKARESDRRDVMRVKNLIGAYDCRVVADHDG